MNIKTKIFVKLIIAGLIPILVVPLIFQIIYIDFKDFNIYDFLNYIIPYIIGLIFFIPWLIIMFYSFFLAVKYFQSFGKRIILIISSNTVFIGIFFLLICGDTFLHNVDLFLVYLFVSTITLLIFTVTLLKMPSPLNMHSKDKT